MSRHQPRHVNRRTLAAGNWLRLEEIEYVDQQGQHRTWEASSRQGTVGAVFMVTVLHPSERYVLIRQYRPPQDGYVLEFPAGLVGPDEALPHAALRELREETGYSGEISWIGPLSLTSPGMSREGVCIALIDVDETASLNQNPRQQCDEGEHIEVLLKTLTEMSAFLRQIHDSGTALDSRVVAYFLGLGLRW